MSTIDQNNTSGNPANASGEKPGEQAAPDPKNDVGELLRMMEQNAKSVVRMTGAVMKLSERADAIERRLNALDDGATTESTDEGGPPSTERERIGPVPRLALRHDGEVLLEITTDLVEEDLEGREVGRYVTLTQAETSDAVERSDVGFSEAAARAAWQIARKRKGYDVDE